MDGWTDACMRRSTLMPLSFSCSSLVVNGGAVDLLILGGCTLPPLLDAVVEVAAASILVWAERGEEEKEGMNALAAGTRVRRRSKAPGAARGAMLCVFVWGRVD